MKKKFLTVLIIMAAVCALGWGTIAASAEEGETRKAELFMPTSYEQYLALDFGTPAHGDYAVSDRYIAVAVGREIFLYDKNDPSAGYALYRYTSNVSSLNFYESGGETYLYFTSDEGSSNPIVYIRCEAEDFSSQSVSQTQIAACSDFIINGGTVCFANASNSVYLTVMDGLNIVAPTEGAIDNTAYSASFSIYNGAIYYSKYRTIYLAGSPSPTPYIQTMHDIDSFAVVNGVCYYVSDEGYFYIIENGSEREAGEAESIKLCDDGSVYLLQDGSIRQYDPGRGGYTDYEIGQYSSSVNRIGQGASDVSVYGSRILIADTNNERVVAVQRAADGTYSYSQISTSGFAPTAVCAGESGFAVAGSGRTVRVYSYDGTFTEVSSTFSAAVGSIAYSYGSYYVTIDGGNILYEVGSDASLKQYDLNLALTSVTADIYGNLYVLSANAVYQLNADFTVGTSSAYTAPDGAEKLISDYAGNLYVLADNAVYKLGDGAPVSVLSSSDLAGLVHYEENSGTPPVVSFAFGFESSKAYLLSDGFMAVTDALQTASLDALDASGVYYALYTNAPAGDAWNGLRLVNVKAGAVTVALDVTPEAITPDRLPYNGHEKTDADKTGVVLCTTANGAVVGFFRTEQNPVSSEVNPVVYIYDVALVLGGDGGYLEEIAQSAYAQEPAFTDGYTVESVGLYRFPQMRLGSGSSFTDFSRIQTLGKGTEVQIVRRISYPLQGDAEYGYSLDSDYYFVRVQTENGEIFGYVPAGFVLQRGAAGISSGTEYRYARLDRGESATLSHTSTGAEITLADREELKVYYSNTDENGLVYVEYTDETGTYSGRIDPSTLYDATASVLITLVIVTVAAAAVILSVCYLLLRKQPTLQ